MIKFGKTMLVNETHVVQFLNILNMIEFKFEILNLKRSKLIFDILRKEIKKIVKMKNLKSINDIIKEFKSIKNYVINVVYYNNYLISSNNTDVIDDMQSFFDVN